VTGRPERAEAAPYYFRYIDLVPGEDVLPRLESQLGETLAFLGGITDEKSRHRYAPDKWSIRQVLGHVNDTERVFLFRALWFARGFDTPLPSYDEKKATTVAQADRFPWSAHVEDFRAARLSTLSFFRNLPPEAWMATGVASDNPFTVRALAYILAGHVAHHTAVLQERYL
jgi:DinB family protein